MHPYAYTVSLRIWHPTMEAGLITAAMSRVPKYKWTVGDLRRTPKGNLIGGVRGESYWSANLLEEKVSSEHKLLEDTLWTITEDLAPFAEFLVRARSEGGRAELFIGVWHDENYVLELQPDLLAKVANLSLALTFDTYPWEKL